MSKRIFVALSALSALLAGGCLFGGEDDAALPIVEKPKANDTLPKARRIVPGIYVGDYSWIDSGRTGFDTEFLLDTNGTYRLFWISENEALYDQRGVWIQKDSSFLFSRSEVSKVENGVFARYIGIEDDTNSVRNVSDSAFVRLEWTPLRQKPYWIAYHRVSYPQLREGVYALSKTFGTDTDKVVLDFSIEFKAGKFLMTVDENTLPNFQADAKYRQLGSFLVTEENRDRKVDSTRNYSNWKTYDGALVQRLQTISDTAFSMWNPSSIFEAGGWDHYSKKL
ncbi:MAG: hypothetical protein ABIW76_14345 [Fibrobacteria bacterium]